MPAVNRVRLEPHATLAAAVLVTMALEAFRGSATRTRLSNALSPTCLLGQLPLQWPRRGWLY